MNAPRSSAEATVGAALAAEVFAVLEASFPKRMLACYVFGSCVDGTAITTSDVDLLVIFGSEPTEEEDARMHTLGETLSRIARRELSLRLRALDGLEPRVWAAVETSGRLVGGADVFATAAAPSHDDFVSESMHFAAILAVEYRDAHARITVPLEYPDADGEFFGYDEQPGMMFRSDVAVARGTKQMVGMVSRMATALVARRTGERVGRKRDAFARYGETIGGPWGPVLDEVHEACRGRWQYCLPDAPSERAELRRLCGQVLGFERHFMGEYEAYLQEIAATEPEPSGAPGELLESTLNYLRRAR